MEKYVHENLLFLLFENYLVKVFHCSLSEPSRKDSYQAEDVWTVSLPKGWRKDKDNLQEMVSLLVQDSIKHFSLIHQEVFIHLVSDHRDLEDIKLTLPLECSIVTTKDLAIVPYFSSAYLESFNVNYVYLDYFTAQFIDNHNDEKRVEWDNWKDLAEYISKTFNDNELPQSINQWLNQLIRPTIRENSFYLSSLSSMMLQGAKPSLANYSDEQLSIIAGGEMFSWLNKVDAILPFLTIENVPSFYQLYLDTQNILIMNKAIKSHSLKLLERMSAKYIIHAFDVVTIKTKKPVKIGKVIGKIVVHDDEGYRTIYPVSEDIQVIEIHGVGNIQLELEHPFFVDNEKSIYSCRNLLVIDSRSIERSNPLNLRSWYDRINKV